MPWPPWPEVDNTELQADAPGDENRPVASWGTIVSGLPAEEGWIKVRAKTCWWGNEGRQRGLAYQVTRKIASVAEACAILRWAVVNCSLIWTALHR
eukprot:Skav224256  [mRNA]  locus=scaffold2636:76223:83060:+ [translate_table: standard]